MEIMIMSEFNTLAIELSEQELDTVAGGLAISIGDAKGYTQSAANDFVQKNMTIGQTTFAGPNGSGTASMFDLNLIGSSAVQSIAVG
jgi:hypothetical protein